jgi:hypothetical protein
LLLEATRDGRGVRQGRLYRPGIDPRRRHAGAESNARGLGPDRNPVRGRANGGRITYSTRDHALVAAIHTWFEAQVADHGAHATMKM